MAENRQECKHACNRRDVLKASIMMGAALLTPGALRKASGCGAATTGESHPEYASTQFLKSMNCSQAVLETYAPSMGMPVPLARRVAAAFAGGMGVGAQCGAVTGAFMVIGMKYGKTENQDSEADRETLARLGEFVREFKSKHGHLGCSSLLGVDMATPEGVKEAERRGLFATECPKFVRTAAEILDRILV